jgi:hypothetical protein
MHSRAPSSIARRGVDRPSERDWRANATAWAAPGVTEVENDIVVHV